MPDIKEYFPEIETMDVVQLHTRRQLLLEPYGGKYEGLPDEVLAELIAITRALRKKAAAPGGKKKSAPKAPTTLESLA